MGQQLKKVIKRFLKMTGNRSMNYMLLFNKEQPSNKKLNSFKQDSSHISSFSPNINHSAYPYFEEPCWWEVDPVNSRGQALATHNAKWKQQFNAIRDKYALGWLSPQINCNSEQKSKSLDLRRSWEMFGKKPINFGDRVGQQDSMGVVESSVMIDEENKVSGIEMLGFINKEQEKKNEQKKNRWITQKNEFEILQIRQFQPPIPLTAALSKQKKIIIIDSNHQLKNQESIPNSSTPLQLTQYSWKIHQKTSNIFNSQPFPGQMLLGNFKRYSFQAVLNAILEKPHRILTLFVSIPGIQKKPLIKLMHRGKFQISSCDHSFPYQNDAPVFSTSSKDSLWVQYLEKVWFQIYGVDSALNQSCGQILQKISGAPVKQIFTHSQSFNKEKEWIYLQEATRFEFVIIASRKSINENKTCSGDFFTLLNAFNLKNKGTEEKIVQLRNIALTLQGQSSRNSPLQEIELEQKIKQEIEGQLKEGLFYLRYQHFIEAFPVITISEFNDNASYIFHTIEEDQKDTAHFKVTIFYDADYYLQVQKTKNFSSRYQQGQMRVAKISSERIIRFQGVINRKKMLAKTYELSRGQYVVEVTLKAQQNSGEITLGIYSEFGCRIETANRQDLIKYIGSESSLSGSVSTCKNVQVEDLQEEKNIEIEKVDVDDSVQIKIQGIQLQMPENMKDEVEEKVDHLEPSKPRERKVQSNSMFQKFNYDLQMSYMTPYQQPIHNPEESNHPEAVQLPTLSQHHQNASNSIPNEQKSEEEEQNQLVYENCEQNLDVPASPNPFDFQHNQELANLKIPVINTTSQEYVINEKGEVLPKHPHDLSEVLSDEDGNEDHQERKTPEENLIEFLRLQEMRRQQEQSWLEGSQFFGGPSTMRRLKTENIRKLWRMKRQMKKGEGVRSGIKESESDPTYKLDPKELGFLNHSEPAQRYDYDADI